jgi:hypothetical protein
MLVNGVQVERFGGKNSMNTQQLITKIIDMTSKFQLWQELVSKSQQDTTEQFMYRVNLLNEVKDLVKEIDEAVNTLESEIKLDNLASWDFLNRTWERNPSGCGCHACNPNAAWFVVCDTCGNKRCPHATDHNLECTNSNAPGQKGSKWENIKTPGT